MLVANAVADALCQECALCCDGTFFGSVVVEQEERPRLARAGLRVVDRDGALVLPQACTALRGCRCSAYADRPAACAKYECALRVRIISGETSEASARETLARMRVLLATIRDVFQLGDTSIWDALIAIEKSVPTNDPRFDEGIDAVSELLALSHDVFQSSKPR